MAAGRPNRCDSHKPGAWFGATIDPHAGAVPESRPLVTARVSVSRCRCLRWSYKWPRRWQRHGGPDWFGCIRGRRQQHRNGKHPKCRHFRRRQHGHDQRLQYGRVRLDVGPFALRRRGIDGLGLFLQADNAHLPEQLFGRRDGPRRSVSRRPFGEHGQRDGRTPPMVRTAAAGRELGGDSRADLQRVRLPAPRDLRDASFKRRPFYGCRQAERPDAELPLVQDKRHASLARDGDARPVRSRGPGQLRLTDAVLGEPSDYSSAPSPSGPRPHLQLDSARGTLRLVVPARAGLPERDLCSVSWRGDGVQWPVRRRANGPEQLRGLRYSLPN
jgi:hypothetical protein